MKIQNAGVSSMFLFVIAAATARQGSSPALSPKVSQETSVCKLGAVPSGIQNVLKEKFGLWKVQEATNLSSHARQTWESKKPLECPGIAVGQFEGSKMPSYAVLLVPVDHPDGGYRFLAFSRKTGQASYEMAVVEQSDDRGASNYFILKIPVSKFFNEESKRKFHVQATEGILMVDSADNEYEADVYFWANGRYQHEPVDY